MAAGGAVRRAEAEADARAVVVGIPEGATAAAVVIPEAGKPTQEEGGAIPEVDKPTREVAVIQEAGRPTPEVAVTLVAGGK